jgi:hypothetical protein
MRLAILATTASGRGLEPHVADLVDVIDDEQAAPGVPGDLRREEPEPGDAGDRPHDRVDRAEGTRGGLVVAELGIEMRAVVPPREMDLTEDIEPPEPEPFPIPYIGDDPLLEKILVGRIGPPRGEDVRRPGRGGDDADTTAGRVGRLDDEGDAQRSQVLGFQGDVRLRRVGWQDHGVRGADARGQELQVHGRLVRGPAELIQAFDDVSAPFNGQGLQADEFG